MRTIAKKNWLQMQVVLKQLGDESIPGYRHSLWRKAQDWQKHKGAFSNMSVARWQGQNLTLWTLSERQACIKSHVLLLSVNKCFNPSSFQLERKENLNRITDLEGPLEMIQTNFHFTVEETEQGQGNGVICPRSHTELAYERSGI